MTPADLKALLESANVKDRSWRFMLEEREAMDALVNVAPLLIELWEAVVEDARKLDPAHGVKDVLDKLERA